MGAMKRLCRADAIRRIKQWCVGASTLELDRQDRHNHMSLHRRQITAEEVFDDTMLLSLRCVFFDDADPVADIMGWC